MSISVIKYDIIVQQPEFPRNFQGIMAPLSHFRASELGCELRAGSMQSELCNPIRTVKDVLELFPGIHCFSWNGDIPSSLPLLIFCADQKILGFIEALLKRLYSIYLFKLEPQVTSNQKCLSLGEKEFHKAAWKCLMKSSLGRALELAHGIPKCPHYGSDLFINSNLGSFLVICLTPDFENIFINLL